MIEPEAISFVGAEDNRLTGDIWDGGGQPVVFLHGGGQTRRAWDATARDVASRGMRAIAVDQRGHGESAWVESGHYGFHHYGADAAAIFRQVQERFHTRPAAVGASLGGLASLTAEMREGPLLDALVLVDITPRLDPAGVNKIQGFMGERMEEGFASLEEAADAIAAYLPHRAPRRSLEGLRKNLRQDEDGRYRWHWDPAFIKGAANINSGAEALMQELIAGLPRLHLPVLLVRGMRSELVQEAHAREFVTLAPAASYVDVGGAGHMVAGDRNDVFATEILKFLGRDKAA
ncbi:MAG: alpha/beta hydrolase [Nitratireductor sp.]|uniref:alpha/beta fold hydrolase n=1 Tax=Nitratireductor sp. B36 TaxID=2762059 RepID=UPI000C9354BB|nr:alpha/beta hydrolase [Nitratireductor sp. B36]MAS12826.1 alpha/beta hydrolase [Nitratireductor sp.]MCC5779664.1 alpha/beta hydrolase [Nitratireductor sp. B36]